jgi:hypothetical protein
MTLPVPTNVPYSWVVISNLSGTLMQVQVAGQTAWLEPFAAMIYNVGSSHQNIVLTPQPGATVTGGTVQATWYTEGEEPSGTWPISLTADAVASGFASLGTQGLVGASGGLQQIQSIGVPPQTTQAFGSIGASPNLQIWNWVVLPYGAETTPTSGQASLFAGVGVLDTVTPQQLASNRVAGVIVPNNSVSLVNRFGNEISSSLLVSPHA